MAVDIEAINARVREESRFVESVRTEVGRVIVGQSYLIDRLLIALLCDGRVGVLPCGRWPSDLGRCRPSF